MDKLEQRVGPEGRKLFERFLRDVNIGGTGARRVIWVLYRKLPNCCRDYRRT